MMGLSGSFLWEDSFPQVYGHTSISFLKRCRGFKEAKQGDFQAALGVVDTCIKPERINALRRRYSDAVLLPVMTNNKLPAALATAIGMRTHTGVSLCKPSGRKSYSAMERLLVKPLFDGSITCGERYIIVDDIVTQGGTIAALRRYVMAYGGSVAAVTALSYSAGSIELAPSTRDYYELDNKFSVTAITEILIEHRIANDVMELTKSQIRYLLRFAGTADIADKITCTACRG